MYVVQGCREASCGPAQGECHPRCEPELYRQRRGYEEFRPVLKPTGEEIGIHVERHVQHQLKFAVAPFQLGAANTHVVCGQLLPGGYIRAFGSPYIGVEIPEISGYACIQ